MKDSFLAVVAGALIAIAALIVGLLYVVPTRGTEPACDSQRGKPQA